MSTKFEQLLDFLVNEEHEKANELFHEIVVEKSREIYENLIAEEADEEEMDEAAADEEDESVEEAADDEEMDESADEEMDEAADEEADESVDLEDSYVMDAGDEEPMGGDPTDDLGADIGAMDDEGGEEGGEDEAMFDIKNAIAELEAAFEKLEQASGAEGGSEFGGDDDAGDDAADDEDEGMMMGRPAMEGKKITREYRETVGNDWEKNSQKTQGQIAGANTGDKMPGSNEGKSLINKEPSGKPATGANAKNLVQGQSESAPDGTTPHGKSGGLAGNVKGEFTKGVEKNIAGSASAKMKDGAALNKQGSGYPANNKNPGPVGSGTGDKAGQTSVGNAKSPLNGAPNRNA